MMPVLLYPGFDPVLVHLGPLAIRWYALAYIVSLVIGWRAVRRFARWAPAVATEQQVDDFLTWATLGVVLGGRLGYILFYQPSLYLAHPLAALEVWQGGMSFHGGALGVTVALVLFCRKYDVALLGFADRIATIVPLGLGIGRIANFINGELWGREAPDWLPWAMQPTPLSTPVHPSQLYEAFMEGFVLLTIMLILATKPGIRARFGVLTGSFLVGYGIARIIGETFREPDPFLGFLWEGITMGQVLSVPMIAAGLFLIIRARPHPSYVPAPPPVPKRRRRRSEAVR
ncbi:MAG: prolipoprotein diacylglyceryl transferase [Acetobacteraceae bacterium]|nr:prolipoprotein diacylglyceryl transferase [Acetobacteraceae bacterium]